MDELSWSPVLNFDLGDLPDDVEIPFPRTPTPPPVTVQLQDVEAMLDVLLAQPTSTPIAAAISTTLTKTGLLDHRKKYRKGLAHHANHGRFHSQCMLTFTGIGASYKDGDATLTISDPNPKGIEWHTVFNGDVAQWMCAKEAYKKADGTTHYHLGFKFVSVHQWTLPKILDKVISVTPTDYIGLIQINTLHGAHASLGAKIGNSAKCLWRYLEKEDQDPASYGIDEDGRRKTSAKESVLNNGLLAIKSGSKTAEQVLTSTDNFTVWAKRRDFLDAEVFFSESRLHQLPLLERVTSIPDDIVPYPANVLTSIQRRLLKVLSWLIKNYDALPQRMLNVFFCTKPRTGKTSLIQSLRETGRISLYDQGGKGDFFFQGYSGDNDICLFDEFYDQCDIKEMNKFTANELVRVNQKHGEKVSKRKRINIFLNNNDRKVYDSASLEEQEAFMDRFSLPSSQVDTTGIETPMGDDWIARDTLFHHIPHPAQGAPDYMQQVTEQTVQHQDKLDGKRVLATIKSIIPHTPTYKPNVVLRSIDNSVFNISGF